MSVMAVSPGVAIDGPLPQPPAFNLLDYAQPVGDPRWKGGVILWPYETEQPVGEDPCASGTFRTKTIPDDGDFGQPTFPAFPAYLPIICTTFANSESELRDRADEGMRAMRHALAEQQLARGLYVAAPYLGDANVIDLNPAGAVGAQAALSHLEQAIAETMKAGWIHADPATAAAWSFQGGLRVVGDELQTMLGTPVVVGQGYVGATADDVAAGTGNSWAFASGPVVAAASDVISISDDVSQLVDVASNTFVYIAEQDLVVAWDTELQAAIRVDWTP